MEGATSPVSTRRTVGPAEDARRLGTTQQSDRVRTRRSDRSERVFREDVDVEEVDVGREPEESPGSDGMWGP